MSRRKLDASKPNRFDKNRHRPKKEAKVVDETLFLTDEELYDDEYYYYDENEELPFNPRRLEEAGDYPDNLQIGAVASPRVIVNDRARFGEENRGGFNAWNGYQILASWWQ